MIWILSKSKQDQRLNDERRGDYELARAKRRLERLLREEGHSKSEAVQIASEQFKSEKRGAHER